jgi:hypothetical protein
MIPLQLAVARALCVTQKEDDRAAHAPSEDPGTSGAKAEIDSTRDLGLQAFRQERERGSSHDCENIWTFLAFGFDEGGCRRLVSPSIDTCAYDAAGPSEGSDANRRRATTSWCPRLGPCPSIRAGYRRALTHPRRTAPMVAARQSAGASITRCLRFGAPFHPSAALPEDPAAKSPHGIYGTARRAGGPPTVQAATQRRHM